MGGWHQEHKQLQVLKLCDARLARNALLCCELWLVLESACRQMLGRNLSQHFGNFAFQMAPLNLQGRVDLSRQLGHPAAPASPPCHFSFATSRPPNLNPVLELIALSTSVATALWVCTTESSRSLQVNAGSMQCGALLRCCCCCYQLFRARARIIDNYTTCCHWWAEAARGWWSAETLLPDLQWGTPATQQPSCRLLRLVTCRLPFGA